MSKDDFTADELMDELARGAARADFAARWEAAELYRELTQQIGPKMAALYARDWRLEERSVRMEMTIQTVRHRNSGLLRLIVKGKSQQVDGRTLEIRDRYAATSSAPLNLAAGEPEPEPTNLPVPPPPPGAELTKQVQVVLLALANAYERGRAEERDLDPGGAFRGYWCIFQRQILRRLGWNDGPVPELPSMAVCDFLRQKQEEF